MSILRRLFGKKKTAGKVPASAPDLSHLLNGYRTTALLYVAAKLKLADELAAQPQTAVQLAGKLNLHAPALERILRGLVVLGLCHEDGQGGFALTATGQRMRSDIGGSEHSLAILNGEEYATAWNHLLHSVRTGETAFDHAFGQTPWEHRRATPGLNECFNAWLKNGAGDAGCSLLAAHDFSRYGRVMDIGGGNGSLLVSLLQAQRSLRAVLFDQPHVLTAARGFLEAGAVAERCELVAGNFFDRIPGGADACILKSVLHDWDDAQCRAILGHCHAAMKPGQPLLVVEKLLPVPATSAPGLIMGDIHMLAVTGGLERTLSQYESLFASAGFELKGATPLSTGHSVLETIRRA